MFKRLFIIISIFMCIAFLNVDYYYDDIFNNELIDVEVKGAAKHEIISLTKGSTFNELINYIDLDSEADTSTISFNTVLYDGMIIDIPFKDDDHKLISLNSASLEELCELPGIKEKLAQRIIAYRNEYSFHNIEEIMEVKGIGESKFNTLKDFITI